MKISTRAALLALGMASLSVGAQAQDVMMDDSMRSTTTSTTTTVTTTTTTMPMMTVPTAIVVRRYVDMNGNISAADVRFSDGMGRGQTRQLRFAPVLMMGSDDAAAYRIGGIVMMPSQESNLMVPPSYDPDTSSDVMRGVVMPAGNTTPGMPSLNLTNEEMLAGGVKMRKK